MMMLENFIRELNLGCYFVHKEMFVYKDLLYISPI